MAIYSPLDPYFARDRTAAASERRNRERDPLRWETRGKIYGRNARATRFCDRWDLFDPRTCRKLEIQVSRGESAAKTTTTTYVFFSLVLLIHLCYSFSLLVPWEYSLALLFLRATLNISRLANICRRLSSIQLELILRGQPNVRVIYETSGCTQS